MGARVVKRNTRATATATTTTTAVAVTMTAVTVVPNPSWVEWLKHNTAKPVSASIPSIRTQAALEHVGMLSTWAMATAMMRTTTAVVATTWVTVVEKTSKKITAKCAHAKIPKANDAGRCACENDVFFFSLSDIQTDTRRVSSVEYILGDW